MDSNPPMAEVEAPVVEPAVVRAGRSNAFWVIVALLATGFVVSLVGVGLAFAAFSTTMAQGSSSAETANVGLLAVLAIVVGGGAICVGIGCLLFGWLGGSPYVSVGSHRSVIATTVLAVAVGFFLALGFLRLTDRRSPGMGELLAVMGAFIYGAFLIMVYLQGVRTGLLNRSTLGFVSGKTATGLSAGLICAVVLVLFFGAYSAGLMVLGIKQEQQEALNFLRGKTWGEFSATDWFAMGIIAVGAPVVEELFFRGYVFNAYDSFKGRTTAYIGSSLAFALIHGFLPLIPAFFVGGLMLAYVYRRSGTIISSIAAHVLNNGLAVVLFVMGVQT